MSRMLEGRVAIVTGAGRGLGRCHALELARHGAQVVVNDTGVGRGGEAADADPAGDVVREIIAGGGSAVADATSVTDFEGVRALVAQTVDTFGSLDVVVNNAGILRPGPVTEMTEDDFDAVIAVHLKGAFCLTKHACDHWRRVAVSGGTASGRVINTTSGAGLWGAVGHTSYATAKAGVVGMTLTVALEMEPYGVTANAISPKARTRMTEGLGFDAPVDGGFDPYDPANASPVVAWLASRDSGWLNGAVLYVAGDRVQRVPGQMADGWTEAITSPEARLDATKIDRAMRVAMGAAPPGPPPN